MKKLCVLLLFFSAVFCYGQLLTGNMSASSSLPDYPDTNLYDCTWRSWAEGSKGNGVGEYIQISMGGREWIYGFAIKNGYGNIDYFAKNNRVKAFKIYVGGTYSETIVIKDSPGFEQYYFKKPGSYKDIRFVIDDVYPGALYNDTCIAEFWLLEKIYDEETFYENILLWLSHYEEGAEIESPYDNNPRQITYVEDADKLMLFDYLPFNLTGDFKKEKYENGKWVERKSKIALLKGSSTLKLTDKLPRIDGATAMYPLYSSFVHAVYPEKQPVENEDMSRHMALLNWEYYPNVALFNKSDGAELHYAEPEELKSIVQCNTTLEAYQRLIDGETDIIFCYAPSDEEIKAARAKGKKFNLTPICKDAFVFIVNAKNEITNITQKQIRDIYSGRVINWKTISGVDEPIIAYQRSENSGSQTTLQSIMKGDTIMRPILEKEYVSGHMFGHFRIVASNFYNYNCAIGYTFLYYMNQMAGNAGIKAVSIDGVTPNRQNIQNNSYPFTQTIYAITTGNESENTKKFISWILSSQGQELVEKTGYIPLK